MPTSYSDRLADYVDVKTRVAEFYAKHPEGRLTTAEAYISEDPDGKVRVWCHAKAYRTPDDPLPGDGWSYLEVPGSTPYTRGSEIENAETSAWGRAIGALGIGIARSIATTDEIDAKAGEAERKPPIKVLTAADRDPGGITGTAEIGTAKDSDFQLRETPDGWALGFRLVSDKGGIKVIAFDAMAQALAASVGETVGKRVTVWGRIKDEEFTPKGAKRPVRYQVLTLERIKTPEYELPAQVAPGQEALPLEEPHDA
jgi:hypothetical protein